jgi:hypothetical protein
MHNGILEHIKTHLLIKRIKNQTIRASAGISRRSRGLIAGVPFDPL